jgi:hypothetical protein
VLTCACAFNSESSLRKKKYVYCCVDVFCFIHYYIKQGPPLFLIKHGAMKSYGSGGKNASILNLESVWKGA